MRLNGGKERTSAALHLVGALLALVGTAALLLRGGPGQDGWHIGSYLVFGLSMALLYTASATYHALDVSERAHKTLRKIDHMMIFVLIAGTYTPICLLALRGQGAWGWLLFGVIWSCALAGMLTKAFWMDAPRWLSTAYYIVMGWMAVIAIVPLARALPSAALLWLFGGGVFYTVGGVLYALKRPRLRYQSFGFHELFHIFILLGTLCHYVMVYRFIQ